MLRNSFKLPKEELTSFYQELILILEREVAGGQLTEDNRDTILELEFDKYMRERDEARKQVQKMTQELEHTSRELAKYKEESVRDKALIASQQDHLESLQRQMVILQHQMEAMQKS